MTNNKIIKKTKELQKLFLKNLNSERAENTLGFLIAKGYLKYPKIKSKHKVILRIKDVLWVARNVEPRVLEVFPAALLHFQNNFIGIEEMPKELQTIIEKIKNGSELPLKYKGIECSKMKYWANFEIPDKRVKPINKHKKVKSFTLSLEAISKLNKMAVNRGITNSAIIESFLLSS